ncbi:MAG: hypothetical protein M3Q07_20530 [Pseudobdellovibrionaceae bacterium]|nr:hypothetical protein [Pseudobdellovibrionaceae bacterium]
MSRVQVSLSDFANIIDVDPSAITRAISRGRLKRSVVMDGDRKKIVVYDGCLEWRDSKNHSMDRGNGVRADADLGDNIMPIEVSTAMDRHYTALIKQLLFLKDAGELISIDKFRTESFQTARATRDSILYIPVSTSHEFQGILSRLLANYLSHEELKGAQKAITAAASEFRQVLKSSLSKSLHDIAAHLSDENESDKTLADSN